MPHTLLLDIGGVLLTNGWDHLSREEVAKQFGINWQEFEERHAQCYNLHETDKIDVDEYLQRTVFWKPRDFTKEDFKEAMKAQSQPYPEMLEWIRQFKKQHGLRVALVSNEGRFLAEYRIKTFHLETVADDFFVSCFVGYQKPDPHIFKMTLDVLQAPIEEVLFIDDRKKWAESAEKLGIRSLVHTSLETTQQAVEHFLLSRSAK